VPSALRALIDMLRATGGSASGRDPLEYRFAAE